MDSCLNCSTPMPDRPPGTTGPTRRYCSTRCRVAAHRARRELTPDLKRYEAPAGEQPQPDDLAPAVLSGYVKPGPYEGQVIVFVQDARRIAAQGDRLARGPIPQLAARCKLVATGLFDALERGFPGSSSW